MRWDSLDEARGHRDAALALSGDWGAFVYLTAPLDIIECDDDTLRLLLSDLDAASVMTPSGMGIVFRPSPVGSTIGNGGQVTDGVWIGSRVPVVLGFQAEMVVLGERRRLSLVDVREERRQEVSRKREHRLQMRDEMERMGAPWSPYEPPTPTYPIDG